VAKEFGLYAVNSVVCDKIGLTKQSSADLAFCTTEHTVQRPENIKLIFEIKMSVVSNYQFTQPNNIEFIGDYKQHKGNPSLLRSDSMLKAIGKSINIRVSGLNSATIPIIVLGNSPITKSYVKKVDFLKNAGVIQGFWSLNPTLSDNDDISETPQLGFQTITSQEQLLQNFNKILSTELHYFSSMLSKQKIGEIIRLSNEETTDIAKAEKFLQLIQS